MINRTIELFGLIVSVQGVVGLTNQRLNHLPTDKKSFPLISMILNMALDCAIY